MIAACEQIPETYENFKTLLDELQLSGLSYMLSADLKAINLLLGLQGFSSTYCCPFCTKKKPWKGKCAELRTLGHIRMNARDFRQKLDNKEIVWEDAKKFYNCINQPLFDLPDSTEILFLIPPPELHLFIGIVNKIISLLNEKWSKVSNIPDRFYKWAEQNHIQRLSYRDKSFNGPACQLLLDKELRKLRYALPFQLRDFVLVLDSFDRVRHACFGQKLLASYKNEILTFERLYCALRTADNKLAEIIPKMHILIDHVPTFCDFHGKGLGYFNEQVLIMIMILGAIKN